MTSPAPADNPVDVDRLYAGDPDAPPRIESLPEPDKPLEALSEDMRRAWRLAEEALSVPAPEEPPGHDAEALTQWSDTGLRQWMARKSEVVMATQDALNRAAEHTPRERIMAGAVLGLVLEDVADTLVDLPMPEELLSEPEVAEVYQEVLLSNAQPYLANARSAYQACAGNAENARLLPHWGRYCTRRAQGLPGAQPEGAGDSVPEGTTEVTVVPE